MNEPRSQKALRQLNSVLIFALVLIVTSIYVARVFLARDFTTALAGDLTRDILLGVVAVQVRLSR